MLLTPNPPHHDHWLAKEFPEDSTHADHRCIRTTVYDDRVALGEAYIQALEAAYPAGSVLRRPFIEGLRGLSVVGDPVYCRYFERLLHARPVELRPAPRCSRAGTSAAGIPVWCGRNSSRRASSTC